MTYTFVISENSITLLNTSNGNRLTIFEDDDRYTQFKQYILSNDFEKAEAMDTKTKIVNFTKKYGDGWGFDVSINDGVGVVTVMGNEYPLADAITKRIIKMESEGFSVEPLVKFLANLYRNPSKTAIEELFLFIDATGLPWTADGHFIAYKIVRNDYKDIYTGKMDNSVGKVVEMPRFSVDDNRNNTCSAGLHFCSKDYLAHYGSGRNGGDRCVLVKINPADVVSIPSDYNNAKGRTCRYEVIGEMPDKDWREVLSQKDYNTKSVVTNFGQDFDSPEKVMQCYFYFDNDDDILKWPDTGRPVMIEYAIKRLVKYAGMTEEQAKDWLIENEYYDDPNIGCYSDMNIQDPEPDPFYLYHVNLQTSPYYFDPSLKRWRNSTNGHTVSRQDVLYNCNLTFQDVLNLEDSVMTNYRKDGN